MFTCSICDETFAGIHQDSTYTTRCGHVFHYHCLIEWLNRSHTCPHCRSAVTKNNLLKLFLQVDPNARIVWNKTTEDEIISLNEQLKILNGKEKLYASTVSSLETQLGNIQKESSNTIQMFRIECESYKMKMNELLMQLTSANMSFTLLGEEKKNIESQFSLEKVKNKSLEKSLYELQCVNSVIIDKLKFQIADLKAEKAYFKSKCHNLEHGNNCDEPSTSKDYVSNEPPPEPRDVQIKNEFFFGHDPLLKLSTKKFLLGCVFLIVEDFNQYQDICNDTSMSKLNIIEHGGSVEELYSPRITHIICGTQKNLYVEQGMQDGKRCVTDFWLTDVIVKKKMLPPWLAHHFPTPYSEEELPCQQYQIVLANFDANEYHKVKLIVELTGANVVNEVSSNIDIVVTLKFEGTLVESALALNIPVVNVQWLNDILCGAQIGLKNPKNNKYQHFDLCDPFSVNYDMVSHLMEAWKTPVIFLKNAQVYDLTKSPTNHSTIKRQKTNGNPEVIDLLDDDDDDIIITYFKSSAKPNPPCVIFCGFTLEEQEELKLIVLQLGGKIATQYNEGTHLVMKEPLKTITFLCCLSTINQIVNEKWLKDSQLISKFIDEKKYWFQEIFDGGNMVCNIPNVLANSNRPQLFKYLKFFVTPGIKFPPSISIKEMIMSAGGTIETIIRSVSSITTLPPNTYFIISCLDDFLWVEDLLQIIDVYLPEFVTNSIMKQSLEVQHNFFSISTIQD